MSEGPRTFQSGGLLRFCALAGWLGALALVLSVIVAPWFVPDYDWISDTISDLGAGRNEWIVDVGLYAYAGGLMVLAVGAAHMHPGGDVGWTAGLLALLVLGLLVTVIGARNEYGDGDSDGVVVHTKLVYGLGLGYTVATFGMASQAGGRMTTVFRVFGALWVLCAPVFFFLPTGIDGLFERWLGVIALGWSSCVAIVLWRQAQRCD
ncbi:DUF998 domain-containing protein [Oceaniglobus indicus]|uniref:DUF998 domain-containing protein n=1 Tax=Oceaniglobus indicus TaxID=2047749 RepID=UPI0013047A7C|nr:DUF998 domain-containing protein [Oceaniglobus indicus]